MALSDDAIRALLRDPARHPACARHLGFELINNKVGIKTNHVPYKSSNLAQLGMLSREIDLQLDTPTAIPLIKAGKIKALAVTSPKRWPDLPDVPTVAELGHPAFEITDAGEVLIELGPVVGAERAFEAASFRAQ